MEKAQGKTGIILAFAVVAFLIVVIVWAFYPKTTGNVIEDGSEKKNFLPEPFYLRAWVVSPGGVNLDIQNIGAQDYLVKSVEVGGCGISQFGKRVTVGKTELFSIKCSLPAEEEFSGSISVTYLVNGVEEKVLGNVVDVV